MNAKELQELILKLPKGSFQKMKWGRELKLYKKYEGQDIKITKVSEGNIRFGINYDNIKAVKEKRENGELPQENQGLNGLEWVYAPYILRNPKNGREYIRVSTIKDNPIKTRYFLNGEEITKEQAKEYCTASNFGSGNPLEVFNVGIENIIQVGKVA